MTGVSLEQDHSNFRWGRDWFSKYLRQRKRLRTGTTRHLHFEDLENYKIVIVIPAHNERASIESVVSKALAYTNLVIVVDDGSTDETAEIADGKGAIVIRHDENLGKAAALNTGFQKARGFSPDVVVTMDADGQHSVEDLLTVIAPVLGGQVDVVVGSRYLQDTSQVSFSRKWGHLVLNLITRFLSGVALSNSQSGYRAFSSLALKVMHFRSDGFSVESEMQFLANQHHLKVKDVPITIQYPHKPKRSAVIQGLNVLMGDLKLTMQYRPLLFFGFPGLVLFSLGMAGCFSSAGAMEISRNILLGGASFDHLLCDTGLALMATGYIHNLINHLHADLLWVESKN